MLISFRFFFTANDENELDGHAAGHADHAEAQAAGDAQSVHCAERQQADAAGRHQHRQAQISQAKCAR